MPQTIFSVEKIRAAAGGFAKGNRYNVTIIPPNATNLAQNPALSKTQFLCEAVSLPTKGIAANAQDIYGPPREIPYRETFTEAALSFILDDAFSIKKFFDEWQENIINPETGNVHHWNDFVGTVKISRLSNDATSLVDATDKYNIELREAYPSAVGEIALGHTQGSEILRLSVTFKYRKWMSLV